MAPSLIVMVREAVVVSATHERLYLLMHCTVGIFDKIHRPNTPIGQKWLNWPTVHWHCDSVEGQLTKLLLISHSILLSRLDARCTSRLHHVADSKYIIE